MSTAPHPLQALLAPIPLFAGLDGDDLPDILRALQQRTMRTGDVIFRQGDGGEACFIVESGVIAIRIGDLQVASMGPGEVFGELALIDGATRSADAVCLEAGSLHRLEKSEFDFLRRNLRPAAFKVLRVLAVTVSERLRETNDHIARALSNDVPGSAAGSAQGAGTAAGAAAGLPGEAVTEAGGVRGFLNRIAFWSKS